MKLTESKLREVIRSVIIEEEKSINEGLDPSYLDRTVGLYIQQMTKIYNELDDCQSVEEVAKKVKKLIDSNMRLVSALTAEVM